MARFNLSKLITYIKVTFLMEECMVRGKSHIKMEIVIGVNLRMAYTMVKANIPGPLGKNSKGHIRRVKNMALE